MINRHSPNLEAHQSTVVVSDDGEILPSYTGPNAPSYSHERDNDIPHQFSAPAVGEVALGAQKPDIPEDIRNLIDEHRAKGERTPNSAVGAPAVFLSRRGHFN